jgi:P4 family phage/plasmid primase-like protien
VLSDTDLAAQITKTIKRDFDGTAKRTNRAPRRVTRGLVADVKQALASLTLVSGELDQPVMISEGKASRSYLAFMNGLIELDTLIETGFATAIVRNNVATPLAPTPEWFSTVKLGYPYDPSSHCPRWLAFLDEVLEGDQERIDLLQEWFGYCLTPNTLLQKFLGMEGEGSNGKSVCLGVLTALVDPSNVSNVPLEAFGERFQLTPTLHKLVNVAPEVDTIGRIAEGALKQFVGGDRMYFDRKGISPVEAHPTARLVIAFNNRPAFVDHSSGVWRRMILLPFNVTIPDDRQDPLLARRLIEDELPGIFNWAIDGLRRLRTNKRFTTPAVCAAAQQEYRAQSNPTREFLVDAYVSDLTHELPCSLVLKDYQEWCRLNGHKPLNGSEFGREVRRAFQDAKRMRGPRQSGGRPWVYRGIIPVEKARVQVSGWSRGPSGPSVSQCGCN